MQKQISAGLFEPSSFEIGFDSLKDLAAVSIDLGEGRKMRLHGRIDRIDLSEDREHRVLYVKVTDYKTGMKKFDLNEFWAGEQMQLIVYMDAASQMEELARRGEKIVCAGIFYYQMKDPVLKWDPYADPDEDRLEDMKVDGLVNDDPEVLGRLDRNLQGKSRVIPVTLNKDGQPNSYSRTVNSEQMELLRARSRRKMAELGKSVFEGEISPSPLRDGTRTACDYCLYRDVCRFDPSRENMGYRDLKHWEKGALWQAMRLSIQENGET
jgi:ATP-dependent helicase/nuclease subunit B